MLVYHRAVNLPYDTHYLFTLQEGVGDTVSSFAYCGNRQLKWNSTVGEEYGEMWMAGDIISCTIDCDQGSVAFYRFSYFPLIAQCTMIVFKWKSIKKNSIKFINQTFESSSSYAPIFCLSLYKN